MDRRNAHSLETALNTKTSKVHHPRVFDPRQGLISEAYLRMHTVYPLGYKVVGDQVYSVRIKKSLVEWRKGEFTDGLVVSLLERSVSEPGSTLLEIPFCLPKKQDTAWVNMVAARLEKEYEQLQIGAYDRIPDSGMLRQLIAGRILYYKSGGSAQNNRN